MTDVNVGLGVIICNTDGKILIGKRLGGHAPKYSIPGGKLQLGEGFEDGARREVLEETGLMLRNLRVVAVTNNLETYREEGRHYISVVLFTHEFSGEATVREPDKCASWFWADPHLLPAPHFDASRYAVRCWLDGKCYIAPDPA